MTDTDTAQPRLVHRARLLEYGTTVWNTTEAVVIHLTHPLGEKIPRPIEALGRSDVAAYRDEDGKGHGGEPTSEAAGPPGLSKPSPRTRQRATSWDPEA
jgi:hypothetical protein